MRDTLRYVTYVIRILDYKSSLYNIHDRRLDIVRTLSKTYVSLKTELVVLRATYIAVITNNINCVFIEKHAIPPTFIIYVFYSKLRLTTTRASCKHSMVRLPQILREQVCIWYWTIPSKYLATTTCLTSCEYVTLKASLISCEYETIEVLKNLCKYEIANTNQKPQTLCD